jgi:glycosyltransferase involved in cell wall biosynthesis
MAFQARLADHDARWAAPGDAPGPAYSQVPLKILFHHRIASRDGQAVHMQELIAALRAHGHAVVVAGPEAIGREAFGGEVALVARLKKLLPRALYELLETAYSVHAAVRLFRACRRERPDAVYERYNLFMLAGLWVRRLTGIPLLVEINAPIFEERAEHDGLALTRLARWCQHAVWRGADHVLPVTDVLAGFVRAAGVREERICVIPNGSNPEQLATAADDAIAKQHLGLDNRLVLGFTGFVRPWNRLDRVLELIAREGEALSLHLLLVGDGPARPALEAMAADLGVADRLTVTGVVKPEDIAAHVAAFDIALIPGVTSYASPLKLFEYMALARATVAPDARNIREILVDGENALLFDPEDGRAFATAIIRLARDAGLRARLGAAARATIADRELTWAGNASRVAALIRASAPASARGSVG